MSDPLVVSFMCLSMQAMAMVDEVGFTPARAVEACEALGAVQEYAHEPMPSREADKLWRVYAFEDGSKMSVHALGCASIEPRDRVYKHLPELSPLNFVVIEMEQEIRNLTEYQVGAVRTMPDLSVERQTLHCIMGMMGEAGEVMEVPYDDRERRIKEMGDCMWYSAILFYIYGEDFASAWKEAEETYDPTHSHRSCEEKAVVMAAKLTDIIKKCEFYGTPIIWADLRPLALGYLSALSAMCSKTGVMILSVGQINLNKLKARYPEKFDADLAVNRNTDAEDAAMGVTNA